LQGDCFCEVDDQSPGTVRMSKIVNVNDNNTSNNAADNNIKKDDPRELIDNGHEKVSPKLW
jgi:hypothetical protein